jgi:hypothetical protein
MIIFCLFKVLLVLFLFFEIESPYVAQTHLKLTIETRLA